MAPHELLDWNIALFLLFVASCFAITRGLRSGRNDGGGVLRPSPPGLPIIGNMHQLGRGHHHRKLQALARRHGDTFLLRLGAVPAVVVSSASMAEEVLKNQDHVFCGRPQQRTARGILYDCRDVGFSPYGERWRQLRRIAVVHLLSVKRVDSLRALRAEEVASLVGRIRAASAPEDGGGHRQPINVSELIVSLTYAVVSRSAFGNKLGGMDPRVFRVIMKEVTDLLETIAVGDMFPRLRWVDWATGLDARIKRTASKLDDVLERTLQEHEKGSENEGKDCDLLDDLLSVIKEGGQGFQLDRVDVKGLILDLFVAGIDTTSKAIEWAMVPFSKLFPRLRWVDWATGLDARIKRTASKLDAVLEGALHEHEKSSGDNGDDNDDLLDDLLAAVKEGGMGLNLDMTDVKGLILDLFLAGTDTTYKTMEWAMAELVKNPKEMEKVQAEVRQIVGRHGSVTEQQLGTMTRLQAALKESLRLHAPVLLMTPREVIHDTKLHGYDIPAKTRVLINAWAIGRDTETWENADTFWPERFLHNAFDYSGNKDFRFIPFGAGRRGCPGVGFAMRLIELVLANILYHFDWELPDDQDLESFKLVESSGFSPGLKSALTLVTKPLQA